MWPGVRQAGLVKAEPGADAGPGAAQRRRLILIRLNSATRSLAGVSADQATSERARGPGSGIKGVNASPRRHCGSSLHAPDLGWSKRAGEENRTLMTSLEGCGTQAPELLRPRSGHLSR